MAYVSSGKIATDEALYQVAEKAIQQFVSKEEGKGLSENNYTDAEKSKLADLENYSLPAATINILGGVKIGTGLLVTGDGTVSTADNFVAVTEEEIDDIVNEE